jgi:hypothetical protein
MARGGGVISYSLGVFIGTLLLLIIFAVITYGLYGIAVSFKRFFVEIASRSWIAILGGLVGVYFSPLLSSVRDDKAALLLLLLVIGFPVIVKYLDIINQSLPQDDVTKNVASFVEGGILGSIFITILTNLILPI